MIKYASSEVEKKYTGLNSLLRLTLEPTQESLRQIASQYSEFILAIKRIQRVVVDSLTEDPA